MSLGSRRANDHKITLRAVMGETARGDPEKAPDPTSPGRTSQERGPPNRFPKGVSRVKGAWEQGNVFRAEEMAFTEGESG